METRMQFIERLLGSSSTQKADRADYEASLARVNEIADRHDRRRKSISLDGEEEAAMLEQMRQTAQINDALWDVLTREILDRDKLFVMLEDTIKAMGMAQEQKGLTRVLGIRVKALPPAPAKAKQRTILGIPVKD